MPAATQFSNVDTDTLMCAASVTESCHGGGYGSALVMPRVYTSRMRLLLGGRQKGRAAAHSLSATVSDKLSKKNGRVRVITAQAIAAVEVS